MRSAPVRVLSAGLVMGFLAVAALVEDLVVDGRVASDGPVARRSRSPRCS